MLDKMTAALSPSAEDPDRLRRGAAGAGFGLFCGTLFVLVAGTINHFAFPQFFMRIDWLHMGGMWLLFGLMMAVFCGLGALTTDPWPGIPLAAVGMAMTILITPIAQGKGEGLTNLLLLIILMIPLTAVMIPLAIVFRWLAGQFVRASESEGLARYGNFVLPLLLGLAPGVFSRMDAGAQAAVLQVKALLQEGAQTPAGSAYPELLGSMPGYPAHAGARYSLSQQRSISSSEGFDVTAWFADGYTIQCVVIVYPGQDPYLRSCLENR
jgi:hypothetical protein